MLPVVQWTGSLPLIALSYDNLWLRIQKIMTNDTLCWACAVREEGKWHRTKNWGLRRTQDMEYLSVGSRMNTF